MRLSALITMVLAVSPISGQALIDFRESRPDLTRLYERVTRSEFVIVGRASDLKVIAKRSLRERVERERAGDEFLKPLRNEVFGGWLITIDVEKTLCRTAAFSPAAADAGRPPSAKIHLFYPAVGLSLSGDSIPSELYSDLKVPAEQLLPGRRYLLYLYQRGGESEQKRLAAEYELDPGLTYFRAFEGARGAREIPQGERATSGFDFVTPAVSAVESFCKAVESPDVLTKISRLRALQLTAEPYWRDSIARAIEVLAGAEAR